MARTWHLKGDGAARIERDENGVPHIRSGTEEGLFRGLGFCHAWDRGLQMLLLRILGRGEASQYLDKGPGGLHLDTFFLRHRFDRGAGAEVAKLEPRTRRLLEAYTRGLNEALRRRRPWELSILGFKPDAWTPEDTVMMGRLVAFVGLAQTQGDVERLVVELARMGLSRELMEELFPGHLEGMDLDLLGRVHVPEPMVPEELWRGNLVPSPRGSNNWAVAGHKTRTGKAILASDPHLETDRLPGVWYEVSMELLAGDQAHENATGNSNGSPSAEVTRYMMGATMPGVPGVLIGRTNDVAWGPTYAYLDGIDSWIEDCRDGRYRRIHRGREVWHRFRARSETVRRRDGDVRLTFYENRHGVLHGDPHKPGLYLATKWASGHGTGAASLQALVDLLHAADVEEGRDSLGRLETAWNWVLADTHGDVAYQMSGRAPRRRPGMSGLVPLPGWDPENDWQGYLDPHEMPRELRPKRGFCATANNDLNHLSTGRPMNLPMGAYRAERIEALLAERDDWDVQAMGEMQMDVHSPQAEAYMEILRPLLPDTPQGRALRDWDCQYDLESVGATQFEAFYDALLDTVFGSVLGDRLVRYARTETGLFAGFYANFDRVLLDADNPWYTRPRHEIWREAAEGLDGELEPWRTRREATMRHILLGGRVPAWLGLDRGPVHLAGGRTTIHQSQSFRAAGRNSNFAPSYRLVTDFAEDAAHTILAGGPSDRSTSRWYASEVDAWLAGQLKRLEPN